MVEAAEDGGEEVDGPVGFAGDGGGDVGGVAGVGRGRRGCHGAGEVGGVIRRWVGSGGGGGRECRGGSRAARLFLRLLPEWMFVEVLGWPSRDADTYRSTDQLQCVFPNVGRIPKVGKALRRRVTRGERPMQLDGGAVMERLRYEAWRFSGGTRGTRDEVHAR